MIIHRLVIISALLLFSSLRANYYERYFVDKKGFIDPRVQYYPYPDADSITPTVSFSRDDNICLFVGQIYNPIYLTWLTRDILQIPHRINPIRGQTGAAILSFPDEISRSRFMSLQRRVLWDEHGVWLLQDLPASEIQALDSYLQEHRSTIGKLPKRALNIEYRQRDLFYGTPIAICEAWSSYQKEPHGWHHNPYGSLTPLQ